MTHTLLKTTCTATLLFTALFPSSDVVQATPVQVVERNAYTLNDFPELSSQYVLLEDMDSGQILYQKNDTEQMYPASMTKLMSALVVLKQEPDLEHKITVTPEMLSGLVEANASVAGFKSGDQVRTLDLLYGVLLPSGADAVQILAIGLYGSISAFVEEMNMTASDIGMLHTHFANPTGLPDPSHVSTAEDIALLLKTCLSTPGFEELINAEQWTTAPLASAPNGLLLNSTFRPLINHGENSYSIPGFLGGKSGFTYAAGRCLASHAQVNDMHLILITGLSSGSGHVEDAAKAYNYCATLSDTTVVQAQESFGSVEVLDAKSPLTLSFHAENTYSLDLPVDAVLETVVDLPEELCAPLHANQKVGSVVVQADGQTLYKADLVVQEEIAYSSMRHATRIVLTFVKAHPVLVTLLVLAVVFLLAQIRRMHHRKRRRRRKRRS